MSVPLQQMSPFQGVKSQPIAIPAPIGGWNTRDSADEMAPTDALILDNWFPSLGACTLRQGQVAYASGLGGVVKTLFEFNAKGNRKFVAGAAGALWDVSAPGAAVSLAAAFGNDQWAYSQFDDASGGPRMGLVNGTDAPQQYDGAVITAMTISGPGLTPSTLNGIHTFQGRTYFWDNRTQDVWFSATNAMGGVLIKFPLGRVTNGGGNIVAMGTWTHDSGNGVSDYAIFLLNSGDILIYSGTDPSTSAAPFGFALIGRYTGSVPISLRGVKKVGADLLILTKTGYTGLESIIQGGRLSETSTAISTKIRGAAISAAALSSGLFGWEITHYPVGNMLIVNVPLSSIQFQQHVMNTETKAWCRFTGLNVQCFATFNDVLYAGTASGTVVKALSGTSDLGVPISAPAQTAWNYLESRTATKRISAIRPLIQWTSGAGSTFKMGVGFDFKAVPITISQMSPSLNNAPWDLSPWDTTPWGDDFITSTGWSSASGSGYAMSARLLVTSATQTASWYSMTYLGEVSRGI